MTKEMELSEAKDIIMKFCQVEIDEYLKILGEDHEYERTGESLTIGDLRTAFNILFLKGIFNEE